MCTQSLVSLEQFFFILAITWGSIVVTITNKVNRKTEILTPCRSETPKNVETARTNIQYFHFSYLNFRSRRYNVSRSMTLWWRDRKFACENTTYMIYSVCKKTVQTYFFCQNFVKFRPIVKIFGTRIAKRTDFSEVCSFSTSPNLCQRTTVLNADVPNCYITL